MPDSQPPLLLYLHGFNSGPGSLKARQTGIWLKERRPDIEYWIPQLHHRPRVACSQLLDPLLQQAPQREIALIGSSLGAFYALWLQAQLHQAGQQRKIALINPALHPDRLLESFRGPQYNPYSNEHYLLGDNHLAELKQLKIEPALPQATFLLLQQGDELLDYRDALERLPQARTWCEAGGDHAFARFEQRLDEIMTFFGFWPG